MPRLVIASNNPGKLREFAALLAPFGHDAVTQGTLGIAEADEPFGTFVENALAKARHASAASGLPALADDSGLCVDALGGVPGVRSARYADAVPAAGQDADASPRQRQDRANNRKLIAALAGVAHRDAHYVCVLAYLRHADDPEPIVTFGRWNGRIVDDAVGDNGFGYDAHFRLSDPDATVAQLDAATKNRLSHRAIAMRALAEALAADGR